MNILGISAFYHDSAAAIISNGELVSAFQEERISRIKQDAAFPINAIQQAITYANINSSDIDLVVFYEKPYLKLNRIVSTQLCYVPYGYSSFSKAMSKWFSSRLFIKKKIAKELRKIEPNINWEEKIILSEHHLSHAASAFFPSPFESAAILTIDGVGEWATTTISVGVSNKVRILKEIHFPHSLGLLYSAFTSYLGFKVNSGEYKVMGLAPYGEPKYESLILDKLIDVKEDGSFCLNMDYFSYAVGSSMINSNFYQLFGSAARKSESELTQKDMDIAASIQSVCEKIVLKLCDHAVKITGMKNLCLAGGVALNCVANGKIIKNSLVNNLWIQPAAGDSGNAIGSAYIGLYHHYNKTRNVISGKDKMKGTYLGSSYTQDNIKCLLNELGAIYSELDDEQLYNKTVKNLVDGCVVGWFQGRMEFGPRSLGNRSILGDPRSKTMQKNLNLKIKFRESFRPFAPSVLAEDLSEWFDLTVDSPYMLLVTTVNKSHLQNKKNHTNTVLGFDKLKFIESDIPAVTHVDYSARIHSVHKETNPKFYQLLKSWKEVTNCSVLVNTSFNIRGEPIVESPKDAFKCFMGTDMDALVIGNCILNKKDQNPSLLKDYRDSFDLD